MSDDLYIALGVGLLVVLVTALSYGIEAIYRLLVRVGLVQPTEPDLLYGRAPAAAICQAPDGELVRVKGRLRADPQHPPLKAPFTGQDCLLCHTVLEQYGTDPSRDNQDQPYYERVSLSDGVGWALVEDDGGQARVRLRDGGHRPVLRRDGARDRLLIEVPMDEVERFLERASSSLSAIGEGFPWGNNVLPGDYRIRQQLLRVGDEVVVGGRCAQLPAGGAGEGGYREAPTMPTLDQARDKHGTGVLISDRPDALQRAARQLGR